MAIESLGNQESQMKKDGASAAPEEKKE